MRSRLLAAPAVAVLLLTGSGGAALAATTQTSHDCVRDAATGAQRCFADFRSAITFATGGAITDAPVTAHDAVADPAFRHEVAALAEHRAVMAGADRSRYASAVATADTSVIGATLFTGVNYTGDSETIRIPKPCVKDGKYDYGFVLGTIGRNSESVQPWANCWIWLHSGDTWDSPRQGPYTVDTPDLGDWKRRAVLMGLS